MAAHGWTVVPYERAEFPDKNVVADFAARIGWQGLPAEALGTGATNASLSLPYCHALGARTDLSPRARRALIRALIADPAPGTIASQDVALCPPPGRSPAPARPRE